MAHAYTPGLRVTGYTKITKDRRLPLKGDVVVKKGDVVSAEKVVAKTALPGNVKTVNVANILSVPPGDVPGCMLKKAGDAVKEGEAIALSKSLFGLFKSTAKANTTGTIEHISEITGQITLREAAIPVEMQAYIDGEVTEVIPEEGVIIETAGAFLQGIFGIGGEIIGTLKMGVSRPEDIPDPKNLGDVEGAVLVVGALASHELILKARDQGAVAVVAGGIADQDLREILGFDLGVAITGSEDMGITVVVTEGFGRLTIASKTFELLQKLEGKKASVNGATQIRAGVLRPEIIVPLEAQQEDLGTGMYRGGLTEGMIIRIIREPHFGSLGKVIDLPPELHALESEARVRVLTAELANGERVIVPRANVEMIEG